MRNGERSRRQLSQIWMLNWISWARFCLFTSLFAVIVVVPGVFYPAVEPSHTFFCVCVELALIFVLFDWGFSATRTLPYSIFRSPLAIAVGLFIGIYLLSCVCAVDPYMAFWPNYERGEGGFQMLHYGAFFALALYLFKDQSDWERAFQIVIVTALLMIQH